MQQDLKLRSTICRGGGGGGGGICSSVVVHYNALDCLLCINALYLYSVTAAIHIYTPFYYPHSCQHQLMPHQPACLPCTACVIFTYPYFLSNSLSFKGQKMIYSLGVRKTVSVLNHKLSKPYDIIFTSNYIPQAWPLKQLNIKRQLSATPFIGSLRAIDGAVCLQNMHTQCI